MGKHGKKQSHHNNKGGRRTSSYNYQESEEDQEQFSAAAVEEESQEEKSSSEEEIGDEINEEQSNDGIPSKFSLYQQSVQSPKGDISYLQKFFLMYVGGRSPLHLQEDFCGTALLSVEWVRTDSRRSAVGLDLDIDALKWCMENNMNKIGADVHTGIFLYHGNVLQPLEAILVNFTPQNLLQNMSLENEVETNSKTFKESELPARDIICAFNYSCCCLHSRKELILYFKHTLNLLNKKGGIFVMDLYGGTSAEGELRMQRKFPNFTYIWEQAGFDIIERKTRISLHYNLKKQHKKIRNAFSYSWRLWSLPEIKDCLEEAGFSSVHFWMRGMPDSQDIKSINGFGVGRDIKYEQVNTFQQQDSWNAYIVAVA